MSFHTIFFFYYFDKVIELRTNVIFLLLTVVPPLISAKLSKAKKKAGKGKKGANEPEPAAKAPKQIIQIIDQPEVAELPPKPTLWRLAGVLNRTGGQPEGERPQKRSELQFQ